MIDTPQFQRLRDLKQLGTSHFVFPGAVHTRFDHSLGVAHLSDRFVTQIYNTQGRALGMDKSDLQVVRLAGLVHDLGHGPFSHVFDNEFLPAVNFNPKDFVHEEMSCSILEHLIDENNVEIDQDMMRRVKEVVMSSEVEMVVNGQHKWGEKGFLCEFVANGRNSIDVDKFDYIMRDCYYCGVKASCDFSRLMEMSKVVGGEMCWKASEVDNIYDLFHTRASLHKRIYTHKKAKAIEFMVADALAAANSVLKLTDQVFDPKEFWKLDDTVLRQIEQRDDPLLADAKQLMHRIRTRDLYTHVNEVVIPPSHLEHFLTHKVTAADLVNYVPAEYKDARLNLSDVRVSNMKINYCKKDASGRSINPVNNVHFFAEWDDEESFLIPKEKVSALKIPSQFEERRVRVYCQTSRKDASHARKCQALAKAFEAFQEHNGMKDQQEHKTPQKIYKRRRTDESVAALGERTPQGPVGGTPFQGDRQRVVGQLHFGGQTGIARGMR